ncbi:hypothetical protein [Hamadaea tsunoensis]|uniref:hypothetical protein n=1 Tax=Hamadaea tsunoensis TaxID=53368 RepID=UPI00040B7678|nr:hypothetical protein [Hamadaea tsunoensis]
MGVPDDVDLDRVWVGVAAQVWRRRPHRIERLAAIVLRSPGLARALTTTPSLLPGSLIATALILAVGSLAARETGTPYAALLAPVAAAAGIAYSYGAGTDPAWELIRATAVSDRMILLVRALAVFAVNAVLGLLASLASGAATVLTFGWLLPMTAVCALALAAATLARSATAGLAVGTAAWLVDVASRRLAGGRLGAAVSDAALSVPYLIVAVCCAAVVVYATRTERGVS